MKYYIISGEASGDLHGSNLIKQLHLLDPKADIRCWGGDLMQKAGATLVKHYRDLAYMGFAEVVKNLPVILRNIGFCKQDILNFKPDVLVLIDYPGFNLRIAEWGKKQGIKIIYYISPQVWAWKENRVKKMKQCIDKMLCILPFEKDYYKNKWDWDVEYVGHPLVEVIEEKQLGVRSWESGVRSLELEEGDREASIISRQSSVVSDEADSKLETQNSKLVDRESSVVSRGSNSKLETLNSKLQTPDSKLIALLPGSRKQEIAKKLPIMLEVAKSFPDYQFVVAQAPGLEKDFYAPFLVPYQNVSSVHNKTYDLLLTAKAALVTSGTATLETALFGVPEIVCYKGSTISYQIAKRLITIKYISLVNLIMDKLVVKELIQEELTTANLVKELQLLLSDEARKTTLQKDYADLKTILAAGGHASAQAARKIIDMIG